MIQRVIIGAISAVVLTMSTAAYAEKPAYGTAEEAKAMLEKVVAAMQADKAKTLAMISKGEGGFKDRDLYPACTGPDGKIVAHPNPARIGLITKDLKDMTGKAYGEEFTKVAAEGKFAEVSYMFPRLGAEEKPVQKVSFVTKVADHICIVGYYK